MGQIKLSRKFLVRFEVKETLRLKLEGEVKLDPGTHTQVEHSYFIVV